MSNFESIVTEIKRAGLLDSYLKFAKEFSFIRKLVSEDYYYEMKYKDAYLFIHKTNTDYILIKGE